MLDQILVMLHPFMPFVTEELWHALGERKNKLIVAAWPEPRAQVDAEAKAEVEWLIRLVSAIRSARTELNIAPGVRINGFIEGGDDAFHAMLRGSRAWIDRMARIELRRLTNAARPSGNALAIVVDDVTYLLELEGVIDITAEKERLGRAFGASERERDSLAKRLGNPAFLEKAKPEAVAKARADHAAHAAEAERLEAALARLG